MNQPDLRGPNGLALDIAEAITKLEAEKAGLPRSQRRPINQRLHSLRGMQRWCETRAGYKSGENEGYCFRRSFSGDRLNGLLNHPAVRRHVGGDLATDLDLAPFLTDTDTHFLDGGLGGIFMHWQGPGFYEVHIFVLPEGRGAWAQRLARDGLQYARDIGARFLWARIAETERHAQLFARKLGFEIAGSKIFDFGGGPIPHTMLRLTV